MIRAVSPVFNGTVLAMAPMAELSHAAFRRLVEGFGGCDLYFTEMLSAGALLSASPYEQYYTDLSPCPEKTILQLVGNQPEQFLAAGKKVRDLPCAGVDVNMGCSVGIIRKRGWGVELMKDPDTALEIVRGLRRILPDKQLSVKLRIGEREDGPALVEFCRALQSEGIDFLTLNPRIRKDGHERPGRWEYVRLLKENLSIPVLGNGDISSWSSFLYRKNLAHPDGFLIARGAVTRPWIFALLTEKNRNPDFIMDINLKDTAGGFMALLREFQPRDFWVSRARRFFYYFTRNLKFGHQLRYQIQNARALPEMEELIAGYFDRNPEEIIFTDG